MAPWDEEGFKLPSGPVFSKNGMMIFPRRTRSIAAKPTTTIPPPARSCSASMKACNCRWTWRCASSRASSQYPADQGGGGDDPQPLPLDAGIEQGCAPSAEGAADKIKKLAIFGAGFMGASVGYVSARAGIEVVLIDRDQASADKGKGHAKALIDGPIKKGRARETDREAICRASARPPITTC